MTKDEFQKAVDAVITDCIRNEYSFGSYARKVTDAVWPVLEAAEKERDALRAEVQTWQEQAKGYWSKIEQMERQEPVGCVESLFDDFVIIHNNFDRAAPVYFAPGAQPAPSLASGDVSLINDGKTQPAPSVKDAIIDDLQSQFDTEGITEHDSGDALIRLSDAIAAVEDNFAQNAPSVPEAKP